MSHNRPPVAVIIVLLLLVISAGAYFIFFANRPAAQIGALTASGTVESTNISIAPELSGKVIEVNVIEGDVVKAGDVLFRLDAGLLNAQKDVATAVLDTSKSDALTAQGAVASAQAQYDLIFSAAMVQDRANRTTDWYKTQTGEFTLPLWYYNQQEQITAAQSAATFAQADLTKLQEKLALQMQTSGGADFVKAETDLAAAQAEYQVAKNLNDRILNGKDIDELTRRQLFLLQRDAYLDAKDLQTRWVTTVSNVNKDLRDEAQKIFDDKKANLKDAQTAYEDAVSTDSAKDILKARAQVSIADELYYTALDYVRVLQTGSESQSVTAAAKAAEQAKYAAARAQTAVKQAEANLALIDAQMGKLTISAPVDGIILSRNVEPGEVVNPGSVLFTLGRLADLTITVYIPEDRYGEISLGQTADVSVDSFPGKIFTASVINISAQAEFTPRNVQTTDGRKTTVFAIKLRVDDPSNKLKAGMPADVVFK
jgi:multidrug resistance efflux pump